MLFLPPRFYPNHVVKIGALTVLLTSLSVFFVTHTGAHARTHTHTHTPVCPSVDSWAELGWLSCPISLPMITLRLGNWMETGQSVFLGDFPTAATPQRSLEQKLREVRFRAANRQIPHREAAVHLSSPTWAPSEGGKGAPWLLPRPCSSSSWALLPPGPSYALVMWPNTFLFCLSWLTLSFYPLQPRECWPL